MRRKRHPQQVRHTVLVVVEGGTEFAFCRYLKAACSQGRNLQLTIKNAHGGSPDKIVEHARRQARLASYGQVVIVFDDDKPLSPAGERSARALRARLFRFTPCVEGFFLRLLGLPVPSSSDACKRAFHMHGLDERRKLDHDAYARLFPSAEFPRIAADRDFAELLEIFTREE